MRRFLTKLLRIGLVVFAVAFLVLAVLYVRYDGPGGTRTSMGLDRNTAVYVRMPDGIRLAVDLWFPSDLDAGQKAPTLMQSTRYWRATAEGPLLRLMGAVGLGQGVRGDIAAFNEAGYVVALVDVRGSGASFGERPTEFGRPEAMDLGEVAGWIADQPWSNGRVGSWGVSYEGNTAAMAAVAGNPAMVAIAPQYADFDAHGHLLWPGGVFAGGFIREWGKLVGAMDRNEICPLAGVDGLGCTLTRLAVPGVKPVDGGRDLLTEAVATHRTSDVSAMAEALPYKDRSFGADGETLLDLSIHGYRSDIERTGVPIFSWAGWMDAGTADGALALYSSFSNPVRLVIGPWSHGGGHHTDPFLGVDEPTDPSPEDQHLMLREFFDHYVRDGSKGPAPGVGGIRYYTFGDGWHESATWPPEGLEPVRWHFGDGGGLGAVAPSEPGGEDELPVDFSHTTGSATRWHTQLGGSDVVYGDRSVADSARLTYTSEPLMQSMEITGAVEVDLYVSADREDGALFAYLEVVGPDGVSRYVTEGMLRAIHRKECGTPAPYPIWGPCHSFFEDDAMPLVPGEVAHIRFALFTTSVLVPAGHRIRIALSGADASVFDRYPASGGLTWKVHRGVRRPSGVVMPVQVRP